MSDMPSAKTARLRGKLTQKRRDMLASSGFGPSSSATVRGSSAIPQIGQMPGSDRTISGSIGQMYSTPAALGLGAAGAAGAGAGAGFGPRYFSGSALNFSRQR